QSSSIRATASAKNRANKDAAGWRAILRGRKPNSPPLGTPMKERHTWTPSLLGMDRSSGQSLPRMGLPYHRGKKQRSELSTLVSTVLCCTFRHNPSGSHDGQPSHSQPNKERQRRGRKKTVDSFKFNDTRGENLAFLIHTRC